MLEGMTHMARTGEPSGNTKTGMTMGESSLERHWGIACHNLGTCHRLGPVLCGDVK